MARAIFSERLLAGTVRLGARLAAAAPAGLAAPLALAALLVFGQGCTGVSEDDLENLRKENQALETELGEEKRRAEVLNKALTGVYRERDRLIDLLEAPPAEPAEEEDVAAGEDPADPSRRDESRIYVVRLGDTLGAIARNNQTTVDVLVALNPVLRTRRDFMVWENDRLTMPR